MNIKIGGNTSTECDIVVYCRSSCGVRLRVDDYGDCSCGDNLIESGLLPRYVVPCLQCAR